MPLLLIGRATTIRMLHAVLAACSGQEYYDIFRSSSPPTASEMEMPWACARLTVEHFAGASRAAGCRVKRRVNACNTPRSMPLLLVGRTTTIRMPHSPHFGSTPGCIDAMYVLREFRFPFTCQLCLDVRVCFLHMRVRDCAVFSYLCACCFASMSCSVEAAVGRVQI